MAALFAIFAKAFFDSLVEHLPEIEASVIRIGKALTTQTVTDAANPTDLQAQLRKQEADAQK